MTRLRGGILLYAFVLIPEGILVATAHGQNEPIQASASAEDAQQNAAREEIFASERWRRADSALNEWLAIQQVYRPEQVAAIRAEVNDRVLNMSPSELDEFLTEMEQRLLILLSPQAEEARQWLANFVAAVRNPEQQLGRSFPDVLNMSASEIRQELRWLEQHRAARQQSHAAFNQMRSAQVQAGRDVQAARRDAAAQASNRSASRIANRPAYQSHYSPRREVTPAPLTPLYEFSPWGTPIPLHPLSTWW
jgi:hypothetical protein